VDVRQSVLGRLLTYGTVLVRGTGGGLNPLDMGMLRGLCVTDTQRWASLPNVPTCREAGIDIVFHFWRPPLRRSRGPIAPHLFGIEHIIRTGMLRLPLATASTKRAYPSRGKVYRSPILDYACERAHLLAGLCADRGGPALGRRHPRAPGRLHRLHGGPRRRGHAHRPRCAPRVLSLQ
jgi:hypothetical protein